MGSVIGFISGECVAGRWTYMEEELETAMTVHAAATRAGGIGGALSGAVAGAMGGWMLEDGDHRK